MLKKTSSSNPWAASHLAWLLFASVHSKVMERLKEIMDIRAKATTSKGEDLNAGKTFETPVVISDFEEENDVSGSDGDES